MSAVNDPISDLLTRLRNAIKAKKRRVDIPSSNQKKGLVQLLKDQGFIVDFEVIKDNKQNILRVALKYTDGVPAISGLHRISSPGLRRYTDVAKLPRVLNGYGTAIISTSRGLMTDKQASRESVGGEILCEIW
jgi:small subunit ribosomal protein S8